MTTKIESVDDPRKLADYIEGYADSALRSLKRGQVEGAMQTLSRVRAQARRLKEVLPR